VDGVRRAQVRKEAGPALDMAAEQARLAADDHLLPDERLPMLFLCAHPAIDPAARTPLMLQTVLGLDAARIASAFLVAPAAMGQRLVRAKAKIRDAGIPFEIPDSNDLPDRLGAVLEAIYATYGTGWEDALGDDPGREGLASEAIWLGRLTAGLLPQEPEVLGLLALMLHCEARRDARRGDDGRYVPLSDQEVARWSRPLLLEAEQLLASAARSGTIGRFQLEAAIQSAHARRAVGGDTDWEAIAALYEGLVRIAPTIGALVGRAAAVGQRDAARGLLLLEQIPAEATAAYQPHWALRAHLLRQLGRAAEAQEAYARAMGLTEDPAVRAFLAGEAGRPPRG
jgi:RNA polymerase sigma-70 factor (ECF subfamily)